MGYVRLSIYRVADATWTIGQLASATMYHLTERVAYQVYRALILPPANFHFISNSGSYYSNFGHLKNETFISCSEYFLT